LEVAGQKLDIAAVNKANVEGLDDPDATKNEQTDVENNIEQAEPLPPAATPAA
jgi:hypothetical protein